jgi:hypothetical protein
MINPLIGCVIPFALPLLLLSAVWLAGKRLEEHRAYVRKLRVATPTDFVLQRFGKSCVMNGLSFAVRAPVRDRAGTVAERCSTGLTRYAT